MSEGRTGRSLGRNPLVWILGLLAGSSAAGLSFLIWQPFRSPPDKPPPPWTEEPPPRDPPEEVPEGLPIVPWGQRHHFPEISNPWYVSADRTESVPEEEPVL